MMPLTTALVICCFLVTLGWVAAANEKVIVEIPQGSLKGLQTTTIRQGKPMYSFKGIPYAKPNVGPNKFNLPEPADSWDGVLDATQHRSICAFYCKRKAKHFGDEDCLYLNVYTPEVNVDAKRAVMVWLHGGFFSYSSGNDNIYGPDFLVEKDVVLVTINYRLGVFGFLNTGDANAPGNAGLKDQVIALRWVRDNIKNFGGCPHRVTIFGQSGGAASVQYHMVSPMSQGLFQNAIQQSGSPASAWGYTSTPRESAFMLGETLGVKTTDTTELVNKLKEFSAKELVDACVAMSEKINRMNGALYPFVPSAEPNVGQEIFLLADPWESIKSGNIADIPLMSGIVLDEAGYKIDLILQDTSMMDDNFDIFLPYDLNMTDSDRRKEAGESFKKFYFDGKPITKNTIQKATDLVSDAMINYGLLLTTKIISNRNTAPVYEYLFTFYNPFGLIKTTYNIEDGVVHGDDYTYLFYSNVFKNNPAAGSPSEKVTNMMTEMWTNFAKESNPTPNMDGTVKVKWEPMGQDDNYLEINEELTMKKGIMKDRVRLWTDLYKDVLGDYYKIFT